MTSHFADQASPAAVHVSWWRVVEDEGFRLFFPLAAFHAAIWPFVWIVLLGTDLPMAHTIPASIWHATEMIIGSWGGVLIGFLTTATPEWTDTMRLRGRPLWILAGLWGGARITGLIAWDPLLLFALACDLGWLVLLLVYLVRISLRRRTDQLLPFIGWLVALGGGVAVSRAAMALGNVDLAERAIVLTGLIFMGILGLAIGRISVPVSNHVLDPSEETVPFRPHPGKLNLTPGLVAIAVLGELAGFSGTVTGWLWIAAGAAFMDRVSEGFFGSAMLRTEMLGLMASSVFAGFGLLALGSARLGAPWSEVPALHLALMGGIGYGVLSVFAIAGKFHTGQSLGQSWPTRIAFICIGLAVVLRALPEMGLLPFPPGPPYVVASILWSAAFGLWLVDFLPRFIDPATLGNEDKC